jgi:hypothetical protein
MVVTDITREHQLDNAEQAQLPGLQPIVQWGTPVPPHGHPDHDQDHAHHH